SLDLSRLGIQPRTRSSWADYGLRCLPCAEVGLPRYPIFHPWEFFEEQKPAAGEPRATDPAWPFAKISPSPLERGSCPPPTTVLPSLLHAHPCHPKLPANAFP